MPYDYNPIPTAGLLVGSSADVPDVELPSDGDLRDAISVDAPLEALLDSIASLHDGIPYFLGSPRFGAGSTPQFLSAETTFFLGEVHFQGDSLLGTLVVDFDEFAALHLRGVVRLDEATGIMHVQDNAQLRIDEDGLFDIFSPDAKIHEDGKLTVLDGGMLHLAIASEFKIFTQNAGIEDGGELNIRDGGKLEAKAGGLINMIAGGQFQAVGNGDFVTPGAQDIWFKEDVVILNEGITLQPGQIRLGTPNGSISWRIDKSLSDANHSIVTGSWDMVFVPNLTADRVWTLQTPAPSVLRPHHKIDIIRNGPETTNSLTINDQDGNPLRVISADPGGTRLHWNASFVYENGWELRRWSSLG